MNGRPIRGFLGSCSVTGAFRYDDAGDKSKAGGRTGWPGGAGPPSPRRLAGRHASAFGEGVQKAVEALPEETETVPGKVFHTGHPRLARRNPAAARDPRV